MPQHFLCAGVTILKTFMHMKSQLYTRTGDSGSTSLVGGERVRKNCIRIEAYGTIDELSSALGLVEADCPDADLKEYLRSVQNELFNVGCYLATDVAPESEPLCESLHGDAIATLEQWIDRLDDLTPKIRAFVLPGGTRIAAEAHLARTICRRAERRIITLSETAYVDPALVRYVNRLSDFLFIAARYFNFIAGCEEITWSR